MADAVKFAPISEGSMLYMGGYTGPFDLAIIALLIGMVLISLLWQENYGQEDENSDNAGMIENLSLSLNLLRTDANMLLLAVIVSCFEGSMFAFVFNWTPALDSKVVPPPHGVIFAIFMMACMCGASVATIVGNSYNPSLRLMVTFMIGIGSFAIMGSVAGNETMLRTCFCSFLLFEFCCGLYFPSVGVLKSEIVPEKVRTTMYNIYRIPLNAVVVGLLLSNISMIKCFIFCAMLLSAALVAVMSIWASQRSADNQTETSSLTASQSEMRTKQV
jgi:hypothetical protein